MMVLILCNSDFFLVKTPHHWAKSLMNLWHKVFASIVVSSTNGCPIEHPIIQFEDLDWILKIFWSLIWARTLAWQCHLIESETQWSILTLTHFIANCGDLFTPLIGKLASLLPCDYECESRLYDHFSGLFINI